MRLTERRGGSAPYRLPDPTKLFSSKEACTAAGSDQPVLESALGCPGNAYWWSGFSAVQLAVETAWLQGDHPEHTAPSLAIRQVSQALRHLHLPCSLQLPKPEFTGTGETVLRAMIPIYM